MDRESERQLVAAARVGYLGTISDGARPHVVPVCFALAGDTVFSAIDHKPKRGRRLRRLDNVGADPAGCLLVSEYDDDWSRLWWVRLDGRARLVEDRAEREYALDELAEKYHQYVEQRPVGAVLALDVDRWSSWSAT